MVLDPPFPLGSGCEVAVALSIILSLLFLAIALVSVDVNVRVATVVAGLFAVPISLLIGLAFDMAKGWRTSDKKTVVLELATLTTAITILVLMAVLLYANTLHIYEMVLKKPR
jgi:sterol desaturase/sphingolipid hydroxylase (fatty acid hydroxylase superfamily)